MQDILAKLKDFGKEHGHDLFTLLCIILAAYSGYNIGKLQPQGKQGITASQNAAIFQAVSGQSPDDGNSAVSIPPPPPRDPHVVASKNSTGKKYYYSWCASAKRISPSNLLTFANEKAAQAAGYTLAGNCN